jgi:hypothetical protein
VPRRTAALWKVISGQDSQEKHVFQILAAALKQHTLHNHKVSIRAKNNDPLEVFVFTSFSYLWELERSGR